MGDLDGEEGVSEEGVLCGDLQGGGVQVECVLTAACNTLRDWNPPIYFAS